MSPEQTAILKYIDKRMSKRKTALTISATELNLKAGGKDGPVYKPSNRLPNSIARAIKGKVKSAYDRSKSSFTIEPGKTTLPVETKRTAEKKVSGQLVFDRLNRIEKQNEAVSGDIARLDDRLDALTADIVGDRVCWESKLDEILRVLAVAEIEFPDGDNVPAETPPAEQESVPPLPE